jgi:membrane-bound lytic murein transglycosylase MltF
MPEAPEESRSLQGLKTSSPVLTGDLQAMLERRMVRVLVPSSRTLFFVDRGHERGVTADVVRAFEQFLNEKYKKRLGKRPLTVALLPTPRDQLFSGVAEGLGDIAAGNITITESRQTQVGFVTQTGRNTMTEVVVTGPASPSVAEGLGDIAAGNITITESRQTQVDFVTQTGRNTMTEVVVTGPASPSVSSLENLSGRTVEVRRSSSYAESLEALNVRLASQGLPPVNMLYLPEVLEDEDLMEMLDAGLLELIVVDAWKARIWAQVLPQIRVREDLTVRDNQPVGWAIRKGSPELAADLAQFFARTSRNWGGFDSRIASFQRRIKHLVKSERSEERRRFEATRTLFEKYGLRYGFDPLMLTAQGFQESRLRQEARSHRGAVGVMQLMPSTGAEMKVGDIRTLEPNIHAGVKYMNQLVTRYFADASFDSQNRALFAFASYNAGPGAIARLRREAGRRRLDPDRWFDQVELVVAERIGIETTTYVRNVYKYYVGYSLMVDAEERRRSSREEMQRARARPE